MTFLTWLAAFAAGLLASMGVGGGMILIIWLTAVMGMSQIDAQGVNLIYFLPIAALSVFIHRKNGLIDLKAMLPAIIAGTVGAWCRRASAPVRLENDAARVLPQSDARTRHRPHRPQIIADRIDFAADVLIGIAADDFIRQFHLHPLFQ